MKAALKGTYVEFVIYQGITEKYPLWFEQELEYCVYQDADRFTFWVPIEERRADYYDKQLIEDYSVFLRKADGDVFVTDYDIFTDLYVAFKYDAFTNSGLCAFEEDCIEYVECQPGVLTAGYPDWFEEFFTESIHFPQSEETVFFCEKTLHQSDKFINDVEIHVGEDDVEIVVTTHCVFLRNKFGEIRGMTYSDFLKYYDPNPSIGWMGGSL